MTNFLNIPPEVFDFGLKALIAIGGLLGGWLFRDKAKRDKADKAFRTALPIAALVVREVAKRTPNKVDDVVAFGLERLAQLVSAEGVELTESQKAQASNVFKELHAQSTAKTQEK